MAALTETPMATVVALDTKETAAGSGGGRKGSDGHDETDFVIQGEPSREGKEAGGNSRKRPSSAGLQRQRMPSESGLTDKVKTTPCILMY